MIAITTVYVTMDHKTSHKRQLSKIDIYASSESLKNNISIDVWFVMIGQYLKICNLRVQKNKILRKSSLKLSK